MTKLCITFLLIISILGLSTGCGGSGIQSVPIIKKAPTAPSGLTGQANSHSSVTLKWLDTSDNEAGFKVYRNGVVIDSLGANATTFTDKGLQYGTIYTYGVSAYNDVGETKSSATTQVKTLNPPIVITLDKIGVVKDHDNWIKDTFGTEGGEIYSYFAVTDGKSQPQVVRIPSAKYISLNNNESKDVGQQVFSTDSVGDELRFVAVAFESDSVVVELAGKLLMQGLTAYLTAQYGQAGQLVGTLIKSQPSESEEGPPMELAESSADDFVGAIEKTYSFSDKWGLGSYQDVRSGDLRLWFTISLASESGLTPKPPMPIPSPKPTAPAPIVSPTPSYSPTPSTTVKPLTVNFDGWYVGNTNVVSAAKNSSVTARLTLQNGSSGQYKMRIRTDVSGADDSTVSEISFNHSGASTTKEISFVPPYATNESGTNGYHVDLLKDNGTVWTLPNSYPPRLKVTMPVVSTYSLNTRVSPTGGGSVSLVPNTQVFSPGSTVTITANPASGYRFVSWSGDFSGTNPMAIITMNSDKTIVATFSVVSASLLSVNFDGWYVNGVKVTTTTKNSAVIARLSMTGGTAGQYKMRIRRDISFGDDVTVNEVLFNYDGTSIVRDLSFVPPYASNEASTNGYHIDLLKDTTILLTLTNAYPPRLRVNP